MGVKSDEYVVTLEIASSETDYDECAVVPMDNFMRFEKFEACCDVNTPLANLCVWKVLCLFVSHILTLIGYRGIKIKGRTR